MPKDEDLDQSFYKQLVLERIIRDMKKISADDKAYIQTLEERLEKLVEENRKMRRMTSSARKELRKEEFYIQQSERITYLLAKNKKLKKEVESLIIRWGQAQLTDKSSEQNSLWKQIQKKLMG
jgi:hypothetical protein